MKLSFTGTQKGMTQHQKDMVAVVLSVLKASTLYPHHAHHGDCIGADAEFNEIAQGLGYETFAHPAFNAGEKRAYCKTNFVYDALPPLIRNEAIVEETRFLIATPAQREEITRSGTWSTIRYAKKTGHHVLIIPP